MPTVPLASQVSDPPNWYYDVSPAVGALVGASSGFPTLGGVIITFTATGLAETVTLNVTVGGAACPLVAGGAPVAPDEVRSKIILAQGSPPFAPSFSWTLSCILPPGQGTAQPVVLWRGGVRSSEAVAIDYAAPTIARAGVWGASSSSWNMAPWTPHAPPLVVPTHGARIRLEGANFGVCPGVTLSINQPVTVPFCVASGFGASSTLVPAPGVARNHSFVEFGVPSGEGTGLWEDAANGWSALLGVGGQTPGAPVLLRFAPPRVFSVAPASGPTRGGAMLTISGDFFGSLTQPAVWLGSDAAAGQGSNSGGSWETCLGITRTSEQQLQCTLPELTSGGGAGLSVRIQVADLVGEGGSFNYSRPFITNLTIWNLTTLAVATTSGGTSGGGVDAQWTAFVAAPEQPGGGAGAVLVADPQGGNYLVINGENFGRFSSGLSCAFVVWDACIASAVRPCLSPVCDGLESWPGEGEVPAAAIMAWNHDSIVLQLQPGAGRRVISVVGGGQASTPAVSFRLTPDLRYAAPVITDPIVFVDGNLSTDGGDALRAVGLNLLPPPIPTTSVETGVASVPSALLSDAALLAGFAWPLSLPLPSGKIVPLAQPRISFGPAVVLPLPSDPPLSHTPRTAYWTGVGFLSSSPPPWAALWPSPSPVAEGLNLTLAAIQAAAAVAANLTCWFGGPSTVGAASTACANASTMYTRAQIQELAAWAGRTWPTSPPALTISGADPTARDGISFVAPPGVGVNKSVSVTLIDTRSGKAIAVSNAVNVSYDPPVIDRVLPIPLVRIAAHPRSSSMPSCIRSSACRAVRHVCNLDDAELVRAQLRHVWRRRVVGAE